MKVFVIKKGTNVLLTDDNGGSKKMKCKVNTDFVLEDIVNDPISFYNENKNTNPERIPEDFFGINYYKFLLTKGRHTKSNFKYVYVKYCDVEVLC